MKKSSIALIVLSLFLGSCSIFTEEESSLFLDTHNSTVWERIVTENPEEKQYMRILSNPKKVAETWSISDGDNDCYEKKQYFKMSDINIVEDKENTLRIKGTYSSDSPSLINFSIIDGVLIEKWSYWNAHGGNEHNGTWVKSEVNIDDLERCN